MLLSGVRSSCDMFARNSDLYLEVSASCSAFSSSSCRASSIWRFFRSTSRFCSESRCAFSSSSSFVCCSSSCCSLEQLLGSLERLRLLLQPPVGLLQLLLLVLQLLGERLRLLEQLLRPHVRRDRVQDDADALGELVQERQVGLAEAVERGQLDDRQHLALEEDRQHHDVARRRFAQAGADLDVVVRAPR